MALDAATLALTAAELKATLTDAKIAKIFELTRDELVLTLRTRTETYALLPGTQRLCPGLSDRGDLFETPRRRPLLYADAQAPDRRQAAGCADGAGRPHRLLDFQCTNEMGDLVRNISCAELMGRYSNLYCAEWQNY